MHIAPADERKVTSPRDVGIEPMNSNSVGCHTDAYGWPGSMDESTASSSPQERMPSIACPANTVAGVAATLYAMNSSRMNGSVLKTAISCAFSLRQQQTPGAPPTAKSRWRPERVVVCARSIMSWLGP